MHSKSTVGLLAFLVGFFFSSWMLALAKVAEQQDEIDTAEIIMRRLIAALESATDND